MVTFSGSKTRIVSVDSVKTAFASVTRARNVKAPAASGVPVTAPVTLLSTRPGGSDPVVMASVRGSAPPTVSMIAM